MRINFVMLGASRRSSLSLFNNCSRLFGSSFTPRTIVVQHELKAKEAAEPAMRVNWKEELASLSPEIKEELQTLRNEDPFKNSLTQLAKKHSLTRRTVGAVAKLNADNKERVISADIYKMNPSNNWKGPVHYRKIRTIQVEREEYDRKREKLKQAKKNIENAKANATLV